ncbi:MAG: winged helix-turn-helix domain-containing protein [Treponema sp.]|nr:winged helix-turn-helix domain-containing protein [Treponema sp.]
MLLVCETKPTFLLSRKSRLCGSEHFAIPFDHQQLADYLSIERSAMSVELSRMQNDGLIRYRKNDFTLIADD